MRFLMMAVALIGMIPTGLARAADPPPLSREAKIPLGSVKGRIDHLAFDPDRSLLFVAELGNDSVGVVDLQKRSVAHHIAGLSEPQGVAWHAPSSTLYVANGGDGSVRLFQATDFAAIGRIDLGADADNVRIDSWRNRIVVGYGKGALALIDPVSRRKTGELKLAAHPEGFQFDGSGARIAVNVPDAGQVTVLDAVSGSKVGTFENADASANFPMAIDADANRVLVVYRRPARLAGFGIATGKRELSIETCRDADDVFVDARRHRIYVTCGEGAIDVFAQNGGGYARIDRIATVSGARTGLFVPSTDRLYLAVRASGSEPAAIWVFSPK